MARTKRLRKILLPVAGVLIVLALPVVALEMAQSHPDLLANAADRARQIVGPAPVAAVENAFYGGMDQYNQLRFRLMGDQSGWQLTTPEPVGPPAQSAEPSRAATANAAAAAAPLSGLKAFHSSSELAGGVMGKGVAGSSASLPLKTSPLTNLPIPGLPFPQQPISSALGSTTPYSVGLAPLVPVIQDPVLGDEGTWKPLVTDGQPSGPAVLWQTIFRPDPKRPFARVALVAMDLSLAQVHIVVGTQEPVSTVLTSTLRPGLIPLDVQKGGHLIAAWNGGFKAIHGHYGMMTDGTTWLPAKDGMATAALDQAGNLVIGAWGRGVGTDGKWAAWRQNNPPLIEDGTLNPDVVKFANTIRWGASVDGAVFIWRSGMGLTQDRRWLIYAAGNSLSVQTLTNALQSAGAWNAMQLDVNASWERFVTFAAQPQTVQMAGKAVQLPLTAHKLINQMSGGPAQFLVPNTKDFFYLTAR